jgi:hypothetical protein
VQKATILGVNGTEFVFAGLRHNVSKIKSFRGGWILFGWKKRRPSRSIPSTKTVDAYIHYCWCVAAEIVNGSWRQVQAVAAALLDQKTIKYWDLVEIISPGTLDLRASLMRHRKKA